MKKIISMLFMIAFAFDGNAQVNQIPPYQKTDTGRVDPGQAEKINDMPMDSSKNKLSPALTDTTMHRRKGDDEDPKRNNPKKKE
ncbi:MAG: hypothetical protein ABIT08_13620 [Bacteroidia bacterium]